MTSKLRKPVRLVARAASSKQIDLSWNPALPSDGIVAYHIERNCPSATKCGFTQIASVPGTTYTDTIGLFSATKYEYRLRAVNVAGDTSPYSAISKSETYQRQPALKDFWTKANAALDSAPKDVWWISSVDDGKTWQRGPLGGAYDPIKSYRIESSAYVESLCQLKAIEATMNASNTKGWPANLYGKGWNTDVHFAIAGYENAKVSLLTFDATKGTLVDRLFYKALSSIKEAAKEEADSWGGPRPHKKDVLTPEVSNFSSGKVAINPITGDIPPSLGEVVMTTLTEQHAGDSEAQADAEMTVDKLLKGISPQGAKLLRLHIGEEVTLAELSREAGCSISTIDRHIKKTLGEIQAAVQSEEFV